MFAIIKETENTTPCFKSKTFSSFFKSKTFEIRFPLGVKVNSKHSKDDSEFQFKYEQQIRQILNPSHKMAQKPKFFMAGLCAYYMRWIICTFPLRSLGKYSSNTFFGLCSAFSVYFCIGIVSKCHKTDSLITIHHSIHWLFGCHCQIFGFDSDLVTEAITSAMSR